MRKKKITTKKKPRDKKAKPEKESENEKPFDYGGIPARDLKKSLGCG